LRVVVAKDVRVGGRGAAFDGREGGLHGAPAGFEGFFARGIEY
jgi:hypothetical protein